MRDELPPSFVTDSGIPLEYDLCCRDEQDANRKCDCTFLCKFCRGKRDELEKGHE